MRASKSSEGIEIIVKYQKGERNLKSFCQWVVPQINDGIAIVSLKRK
jgi:hypothetical protein